MLKIEHLQSGYGHTPVLFGLMRGLERLLGTWEDA